MSHRKIPLKSGKEIDGMRAACAAASRVLAKLADLVAPGVSTGELDAAAADFIAEEGCKSAFLGYRNFPGQICVSVNEEIVHGIGGPRRVQYGDIVKLDVGVVRNGWVGDNATTVPVGAISGELTRLLEVTERSLYEGIKHARDGVKLGTLSAAIEAVVVDGGMTVVREFVGHGVGRKLHEEPQIPNYGEANTGPRLKPGMTLAIEPMVNLGTADFRILADGWTVVTADRRYSSHFEHTVLVTSGEPEILTWRNETRSKLTAR